MLYVYCTMKSIAPAQPEAVRMLLGMVFVSLALDLLRQADAIAREHGALGAKLTGGGGGGSIIAICDGDTEPVVSAIRAAGFQAMPVRLGADLNGA